MSGSPQHTSSATSWSRRGRALLAVVVLAVGGVASWPASGQDDLDSLRADRRRVQAERAQAAVRIDAQEAEVDELTDALEALQTQVTAAEVRVSDAQRRLADAEERVVSSEQAVADQRARIAGLEGQLANRAVESFVGQSAAGDATMFDEEDLYQSMRMRSLVDSVTQTEADVVEQLEAAREDLEVEEEAARVSRQEAEAYRVEVEGELDQLAQARNEQAELTAAADARLDRLLGEAQSLAALENRLGQEIAAAEAEAARRLAEAQAAAAARAKAAADAAAAKAAAAGRASSASGTGARAGSGGGSAGGSSNGGGDRASSAPPVIVGSGAIVSVEGISVHRSIADQLARLLAAASSDGIHLSGGGYRDSSSQIRLRQAHCGSSQYAIYQMSPSQCRPPTARPGASMHERGMAVDFVHNGRVISSRSSPAFQWLAANAGSYGFRNLPSEPWHWSTTGS